MSVQIIIPKRFGDETGWFSEVCSKAEFRSLGIDCRFVQNNHFLSFTIYTLRGLHYQRPPPAQAKLVCCARGQVFDVAFTWICAEASERTAMETVGQERLDASRSSHLTALSRPSSAIAGSFKTSQAEFPPRGWCDRSCFSARSDAPLLFSRTETSFYGIKL